MGTDRAASNRHFEPEQRVRVAFGDHFHAAIRLVSHKANDTLAPRRVFGEEPEADALHAARHDEAACDQLWLPSGFATADSPL